MGGEEDDVEEAGDAAIVCNSNDHREWVKQCVVEGLKLKEDKWAEMENDSEESRNALHDFLESTKQVLFFHTGERDKLFAANDVVSKYKKKAVYFIKLEGGKLDGALPASAQVVHGDFSSVPLEHLLAVAKDVFYPIISNPMNQQMWPEVVSNEVLDKCRRFLARLLVLLGEVKGQTVLPLPPDAYSAAPKIPAEICEKERLHALEDALVSWTQQIRNVLKADPEQLTDSGSPGTLEHMQFWETKKINLNCIHEQLLSPKIRSIVKVLALAKSSYIPAFTRLCEEVEHARAEANSNVGYLTVPDKLFGQLAQAEEPLEELGVLFPAIMHSVMLVWIHSPYFNTPARLVVLIRMIANDLVAQGLKQGASDTLLELEPPEAVEQVKGVLVVCRRLHGEYLEYKNQVAVRCPLNPWRVQSSALFGKLNSFIERAVDVQDIVETRLQFSRLEKVEIGGTKGKELSASIETVYTDFQNALQVFENVQYDMFDIEVKEFEPDYYQFRLLVKEMERRLSSVIAQGLDDCAAVEDAFKLLDSFEGLLDRDLIQNNLEKHFIKLLRQYRQHLKHVQSMFVKSRTTPPIYNNMPPIAGALHWSRGLAERANIAMYKFRLCHKTILESDEMADVEKSHASLMESLQEYERLKCEQWAREVDASVAAKLKQPLLQRRASNDQLVVNFDGALVRLLREVKYFLQLGLEVPDTAMAIYKKAEVFRTQTGNLELIVNKYNWAQANLLDVERPLVQQQLNDIDAYVEKGITSLNWKSHGIHGFISQSMAMVKETETILQTIKANVLKIEDILKSWNESPLMDRTEQGLYSPDELQDQQENFVIERCDVISETAEQIHEILLGSLKALRVHKNAEMWHNYVAYVNQIIVEGFCSVVISSLTYLHDQVDPEKIARLDLTPLIEVKLDLVQPEVLFFPEVEVDSGRDSVHNFVCQWIKGFCSVARCMKRIDSGEGDYMIEVESRLEVRDLVASVTSILHKNVVEVKQFESIFLGFSHLWRQNLDDYFQEWWNEVAVEESLPQEELEALEQQDAANSSLISKDDQPEEEAAQERPKYPPLEAFEAKIIEFQSIQDEINMLPNTQDIGWLRIDSKPLRSQMQYWAGKWVSLFSDFMLNNINASMNGMIEFMAKSSVLLSQELPEGDEEQINLILGCIRDIKKRTSQYNKMVEPLKAQASALKKFHFNVEAAMLSSMDDAPAQWDKIKDKMFETKDRLRDAYNQGAAALKSKEIDFVRRMAAFRDEFQTEAPFKYPEDGCPAAGGSSSRSSLDRLEWAYESIDRFLQSKAEFETEALYLNSQQELYELAKTDIKVVESCSKELELLKHVWDVISLVSFTFDDWRRTLWDNIDTEYFVNEAKKLKDGIRRLDKKTRTWIVYNGLEDAVANMLTALPLIQLLKSPSMRQRHWVELMSVTGTHFTVDSNLCLDDIIGLQLHRFEEDVEGVVIKSAKELVIEKTVSKISDLWDKTSFEYFSYPKDDTVKLLRISDELVEAREEHQVQLQAMQASKYIQVFEEQVNSWLGKLGMVEAVCSIWTSVQEKWMQLESIFIGSEDIRAQLPDDTKRFDTIDEDWRALMSDSCCIESAIEVCNRSGQLEKLEVLEEMLELCQKALNDYLDTKRTAFPRFYFVAPADLLDILSKGSNPLDIQQHFSKFTSIQRLEFDADEVATGKAHHASAMYSGEGECVKFHETFDATGQAVENYLANLVEHHRQALKSVVQAGHATYVPATRDEWLFGFCCQVVLVVTMTWWVNEVSIAFSQYEDGNDTALKDQLQYQIDQLKQLSALVRKEIPKEDRIKIVTLITIDVHSRDVVNLLVDKRVENSGCFEWLSQLRLQWDDERDTCLCDCCDARFIYGFEYVGNCGRLVITPLTDRCYITLTQALRLKMGGAPAGPAGTGKTETTKDLGRALGIYVIVFNCSPQMNSSVMSTTFKGLATTGAWGCFDEFNRIAIETLSVVAGQFRSVLKAIRSLAKLPAVHETVGQFDFEGEECSLVPTAMAFITMNPGYAGRTELPENVKALFRACAMIVPDMEMICENMLFSQGFETARPLSRKFMLLFRLNKDLLSVQVHYDWGLRAVKSILVIAGTLKRADPEVPEDGVLMRALRDCNLPKLVLDDVDVFMGVVNDIFPGWDLPRRRDEQLESMIQIVCKEKQLQPEEIFIAKISALADLFAVRWSVFILGPSGSGKSAVWRVLQDAQTKGGQKTIHEIINPKSQDTNELYGFTHPVLGWKDGIFSFVMRNFSQIENDSCKWIVLDGEVDPDWIESLNTVMDDNKLLTLASNERIPLNPTMKLLIEVSNLRNASPATVSRGGVLMLNEKDLGWRPFVDSWVECRSNTHESKVLTLLFQDYVDVTLEYIRRNLKPITNVMEINMVMTICYLLDAMLPNTSNDGNHGAAHKNKVVEDPEVQRKTLELHFVFACIWGFGSALSVDKGVDHRHNFSEWWKLTWQRVKLGDNEIYDYQIDIESESFVGWEKSLNPYVHDEDLPFHHINVPTIETLCLSHVTSLLSTHQHHVQLCGVAGTAKTTMAQQYMKTLNEDWSSCTLYLNSMTDGKDLQLMMEGFLEKRAGKTYCPIGNKKHIFFLDDLNMPGFDKWGDQSPIQLLIQLFGHKFFFDRNKCGNIKEIKNCQYLAAMNPTAGSFAINGRLQRQFTTIACGLPSEQSIETIYLSILKGHLASFRPEVSALANSIVASTIVVQNIMIKYFMPNAVKFFYTWNLRELSSIFQGLMQAIPAKFPTPVSFARLWRHEVGRVYGDRLMIESDMVLFSDKIRDTCLKFLEFGNSADVEKVVEEPHILASFTSEDQDNKIYEAIDSYNTLNSILVAKMKEYNESNAQMDLVLFEMFMSHVVRIARVLDKPRGNAVVIGVGGSGKQSITKLTAFISGFSLFQIQLTASYSLTNLKEDVLNLYKKAGEKGFQIVWMLTDSQILDEGFLVLVNDFLSSGMISDLFPPEDKLDAINAVRNEVRAEGLIDTNDACWEFFIDKVRTNLHMVLCMSPVGPNFRVWCRKFPALINCTVLDWVATWPEDALKSVATRFLDGVDFPEEGMIDKVAGHMCHVHQQTIQICEQYQQSERRFNYATPKSYLEFIDLYKNLLGQKQGDVQSEFEALEVGLEKLIQTEEDVGQLQLKLVEESKVVEEKTVATQAMLERIGQETLIVNEQKALADIENEKANVERAAATKVQQECDTELEKAEPLVAEALAALDSLDKDSISELKGFQNPPSSIPEVCGAVLTMISPEGKLARDVSFKASKKVMNDPTKFVDILKAMDIDNIPRKNIERVKSMVATHDLGDGGSNNPTVIKGRSRAAGGLASWVVNIVKYDDAYQMITPLRENLGLAQSSLAEAERVLEIVTQQVNALEEKVAGLTAEFEQATEEKNMLEANAELTGRKLDMAQRLVSGLADEKIRWGHNIKTMKTTAMLLIGDTLLAAAFVSYIGAFSARFRVILVKEVWQPDIVQREIPASDEMTPLSILANPSEQAKWQNEGLPADQLSAENAAIITSCARWPLMIDPQLQGITWIKSREMENNMDVISLSGRFLEVVERNISMGQPLMIENIGETIDPVLEPVLSRSTVKRGGMTFIKLGDKDDVEYDDNFRLYLQTKLTNPHYQPEVTAQTTLVNFTVTEKGLEDQLLAVVVQHERPDLEERLNILVRESNEFTSLLKELADGLLYKLSHAEGNLIEDIDLIENLEQTKVTANEVAQKQLEGKVAKDEINISRNMYRPVATRSSLIYFVLNQLNLVDHMYQYSLNGFMRVFNKAINKTDKCENVEEQVVKMTEEVTYMFHCFATRGLFSRHNLVYSSQICFRIMSNAGQLDPDAFEWLLRCPKEKQDKPIELNFLSDGSWDAAVTLSKLPYFENLASDLVTSSKRFKEWCDFEASEKEKLPLEYKSLPPLQRLCMVRCLRPDRMTMATELFMVENMSKRYVEDVSSSLSDVIDETDTAMPVYYILTPGVDVVGEVENAGAACGATVSQGKFVDISLGEGKDVVADREVDRMCKEGGWVILQNVHLMPRWLIELENRIERNSKDAHPDFRLFITSEAAAGIPVALLQRSIKLTQEPPPGVKAVFTRAWNQFSDATWDSSSKQAEMRSTLFCLSFFHALVVERIKFGPQGWNRQYPFSNGDLLACKDVLFNYLETAGVSIPWDVLQFIFGDIMYGGHITDHFDRILCQTYLQKFLCNELFENMEFYPGFGAPPNLNHPKMREYIDESVGAESPVMFGLHPNAEIGFRTEQSEKLFETVTELQPRTAAGGESSGVNDRVNFLIEEIQDKLQDAVVDIEDLVIRIDEEGGRTPHVNVFYQECKYMNTLVTEIQKSLAVLTLGIGGELQMSTAMESLMDALILNRVPDPWTKLAFASMRPLAGWIENLTTRIKQLTDWVIDLLLPRVVWISGFFNPLSFLTAIMQSQARKYAWPLDKVVINTEVTKKAVEEVEIAAREGCYITGLSMEGARWDSGLNVLASSLPKEMFFKMPVMLAKAIPVDKAEFKDCFMCPVYKIQMRGPTFVWKANLKTRIPNSVWILAGVCLLMDVVL